MKAFTVMNNYTDNVFGTFATEKEALNFISDVIATDFAMLEAEELVNDTVNGMSWTGMFLFEQEFNRGEEDGYAASKIYWDKEECVPVRVD